MSLGVLKYAREVTAASRDCNGSIDRAFGIEEVASRA